MTFGVIIDYLENIIFDWAETSMELIPIKIGFGNVEWLNTNLRVLFVATTAIILGIIFIILVWKIFKFFTKLVNKAFGGRKW